MILRSLMVAAMLVASSVMAEEMSAELKAKVDAKLKAVSAWSTDAKIVEAVAAYNANPPAECKEMTQEKWAALTLISPEVKVFSKNALAEYLKTLKDESISEMFVSGANGNKAAFLAKTTNWCHKGKPKHDVPMTGKSWVGKVETDESTGLRQVQVSVPVLEKGKAIGSLVVGLSVNKL